MYLVLMIVSTWNMDIPSVLVSLMCYRDNDKFHDIYLMMPLIQVQSEDIYHGQFTHHIAPSTNIVNINVSGNIKNVPGLKTCDIEAYTNLSIIVVSF